VAEAYSKNWARREHALAGVYDKLQEVVPAGTSREERRTLVRAAVFLVQRALQDKVSPVSPLLLFFFFLLIFFSSRLVVIKGFIQGHGSQTLTLAASKIFHTSILTACVVGESSM